MTEQSAQRGGGDLGALGLLLELQSHPAGSVLDDATRHRLTMAVARSVPLDMNWSQAGVKVQSVMKMMPIPGGDGEFGRVVAACAQRAWWPELFAD